MKGTESQIADAKPKLRWYQFSLRTLLLLPVLVALFMGWRQVKRMEMREVARRCDTTWWRDNFGRNILAIPHQQEEIELDAALLREFVGRGARTGTLDGIHFCSCGWIPERSHFNCHHIRITSDGWAYIRGLNLKSLELGGVYIDGLELARLREALPNCEITGVP